MAGLDKAAKPGPARGCPAWMPATRRGTNRITKILNGCALGEDWRDADGTRGMSLCYYQPATRL